MGKSPIAEKGEIKRHPEKINHQIWEGEGEGKEKEGMLRKAKMERDTERAKTKVQNIEKSGKEGETERTTGQNEVGKRE